MLCCAAHMHWREPFSTGRTRNCPAGHKCLPPVTKKSSHIRAGGFRVTIDQADCGCKSSRLGFDDIFAKTMMQKRLKIEVLKSSSQGLDVIERKR